MPLRSLGCIRPRLGRSGKGPPSPSSCGVSVGIWPCTLVRANFLDIFILHVVVRGHSVAWSRIGSVSQRGKQAAQAVGRLPGCEGGDLLSLSPQAAFTPFATWPRWHQLSIATTLGRFQPSTWRRKAQDRSSLFCFISLSLTSWLFTPNSSFCN